MLLLLLSSLGRDNIWGDLLDSEWVFLWLVDLEVVWHDDGLTSLDSLDTSHDLDLESEDTLSELDVSDGSVDEVILWLSSRDLVSLGVLLRASSLSSDLTRDDDLTSDGSTSSHDGSQNVVGSHSHWVTLEKLELKLLYIEGSAEVSVVVDWLDRDDDLGVLLVVSVSLFNQTLDFSDSLGLLLQKSLVVGGLDSDLSVHGRGVDFNSSVSLSSQNLGEEFVKLGVENSIGNKSLFGVDLLELLLLHFDDRWCLLLNNKF